MSNQLREKHRSVLNELPRHYDFKSRKRVGVAVTLACLNQSYYAFTNFQLFAPMKVLRFCFFFAFRPITDVIFCFFLPYLLDVVIWSGG